MSSNETATRRSERSQFHQAGLSLLLSQTRAIDALIYELHALDSLRQNAEIRVPLLMLQAVGVSVHSVLALTRERNMSIRDCFGIARSAVETAINSAFVAVVGKPIAERAVRHMRQKRWRDLRRDGDVGGLRVSVWRDVTMNVHDLPGLQEALDEFTNKRGHEIRDWTPESLEQRIAAVSDRHERAGLCLGVVYFSIYRPASELLHGTYYGVNLFWQGSRELPVDGRDEFDELWVTEHFITLLTALFFAVSGVIDAIAAVHSLTCHSQLQESLSQKLSMLIEAMSDGGQDSEHHFRKG